MAITLKELREKTGLSQKEFAARFEIPLSTYRKWEQGESKPADYVIKMLAAVIPSEAGGARVIEGQKGKKYYYNKTIGVLTDASGVEIKVKTDITGVKEKNLALYVEALFDSYYEILDKFERDCKFDRSNDIIWS